MWQHRKLLNVVRLQRGWSYQPFAISFTLTGACNLRCKMCSTRSQAAIYLSPELVMSTVEEVAKKWWWKRPVIHLIGGEPMLHHAFPALVEGISARGFPLAITTNGFLLEKNADLLLQNRVKHITVSIDGPEEVHDSIRGVKGSFRRAKQGVAALRKAGARGPSIALNCTMSPDNQGRLVETLKELETWGIDSVTFQHLVFDREDRTLAEAMKIEILAQEQRQITGANWRMPVNIFPPIREEHLEPYYRDLEHPFGNSCVVPWMVARVYPGTEVAPCMDLYMGMLGDDPLSTIWNSKPWRRFRRLRLTGKLLPGCLRCCHRQYYG